MAIIGDGDFVLPYPVDRRPVLRRSSEPSVVHRQVEVIGDEPGDGMGFLGYELTQLVSPDRTRPVGSPVDFGL